jgi:hypothetical protein
MNPMETSQRRPVAPVQPVSVLADLEPGVLRFVRRAVVAEALDVLGFTSNDVVEVTMTPDKIRVVELVRTPDGRPCLTDDGTAAKTHATTLVITK